MLVLIMTVALATELVLQEPTDERRYKIEAFGFAPVPGDRYNLDWRQTTLTFWSAVLVCKREFKRTDTCTFAGDKVEFGYLVDGESELNRYEIAAPPSLEVTYGKTGRVKLLAKGKRDAFWEQSATALLGRHEKPEGLYWKPDQWREIGSDMEDSLRYYLAGALEVQVPKKGDASSGWVADAPALAQTWLGGSFGGRIEWRAVGSDGDIALLQGSGRFGEQLPTTSTAIGGDVKGLVEQQAAFDTKRGFPVQTRVDITFEGHLPGYDTRRVAFMRLARDGDTHLAGQIEGTPIRP